MKKIFLAVFTICLLSIAVQASSITRSIAPSGDNIVVTLHYIDDSNDDWILISENYPLGWQVVDAVGGTVTASYHQIKWFKMTGADTHDYVYTLTPNIHTSNGNVGNWAGSFTVSSFSDDQSRPITGTSTYTIVVTPPSTSSTSSGSTDTGSSTSSTAPTGQDNTPTTVPSDNTQPQNQDSSAQSGYNTPSTDTTSKPTPGVDESGTGLTTIIIAIILGILILGVSGAIIALVVMKRRPLPQIQTQPTRKLPVIQDENQVYITNYIKSNMNNFPVSQLRTTLIKKGWRASDVDRAIQNMEK